MSVLPSVHWSIRRSVCPSVGHTRVEILQKCCFRPKLLAVQSRTHLMPCIRPYFTALFPSSLLPLQSRGLAICSFKARAKSASLPLRTSSSSRLLLFAYLRVELLGVAELYGELQVFRLEIPGAFDVVGKSVIQRLQLLFLLDARDARWRRA